MNTGINAPIKNLIAHTAEPLTEESDLAVRSFRYAYDATDAEIVVLAGPGAASMLGVINLMLNAIRVDPMSAITTIEQLRLLALQPPVEAEQPAGDDS